MNPNSVEFPYAEMVAEREPPRWFIGGVIFVIAGWLFAAAFCIQIEYFDGLSAIANARFFLGKTDRYIADRAPMMAIVLIPSELVRNAFQMHPLDVRPYHITLAILHTAYLVVAYRLLTQIVGNSWIAFIAWAAAIPNFIYFSYSPFVSHDIFPGIMLFCMLVLGERLFREPTVLVWIALVAVGAIAALVKQTFGIFWILLLLASLYHWTTSRTPESKWTFLRLASGAMASASITWLIMGIILANADPHTPLLIRPLRNLQYLSNVYQGKNVVFPLWIYLRNGPSYGWLALLLAVPGWILSMRGTRAQQSIAIAWLGGLALLHLLPLREVRYIAFLAPLTATLLVPVLRLLAQSNLSLIIALLVLSFDVRRCSVEAVQMFDPFYTSGIQRKFFKRLDEPGNCTRPVFVNAPMMSFVAPSASPFAADRYHRIFHFGVVHLRSIYGCQDLRVISDETTALHAVSACPDQSLLFYSTQILARGPSWSAGMSFVDNSFDQCAASFRSQSIAIKDIAVDEFRDVQTVQIVRFWADGNPKISIQGTPCLEGSLGELLPILQIRSTGKSYWLHRSGSDSYIVSEMPSTDVVVGDADAAIRRFEVDRRASIKFDQ